MERQGSRRLLDEAAAGAPPGAAAGDESAVAWETRRLIAEHYDFFLQDAQVKVKRSVSAALCYFAFAVLFLIRLVAPAPFIQEPLLWIVVFSPLFVLDILNFVHLSYISANDFHFGQLELFRQGIIAGVELLFKGALCAYVISEMVRGSVPLLGIIMLYAAGIGMHVLLGCVDDREGDFMGFDTKAAHAPTTLRIVFLMIAISLSLKINFEDFALGWPVLLWPIWLASAALLPFAGLVAFVASSSQLKEGFVWIASVSLTFALAGLVSGVSLAQVLDGGCPADPRVASADCRGYWTGVALPWILVLPIASVVTLIFRRKIALSLHERFFQVPRILHKRLARAQKVKLLPAPAVMFKITPTYYSREPNPDLDDDPRTPRVSRVQKLRSWKSTFARKDSNAFLSRTGQSQADATARDDGLALSQSQPPITDAAGNEVSQNTPRVPRDFSNTSIPRSSSVFSRGRSWRLPRSSSAVMGRQSDTAGNAMLARGSSHRAVVQDEQLCFVCYENPPNAVLLECGHSGICVDCAMEVMNRRKGLANCPICRSAIAQVVKVHPDALLPPGLFAEQAGTFSLPQRPSTTVAWDVAAQLIVDASKAAADPESDRPEHTTSMEIIPDKPLWAHEARRHAIVVQLVRRS